MFFNSLLLLAFVIQNYLEKRLSNINTGYISIQAIFLELAEFKKNKKQSQYAKIRNLSK